jgi:hypothetical protein
VSTATASAAPVGVGVITVPGDIARLAIFVVEALGITALSLLIVDIYELNGVNIYSIGVLRLSTALVTNVVAAITTTTALEPLIIVRALYINRELLGELSLSSLVVMF